MQHPVPVLNELLEQVRSTGSIDVGTVEHATGATLRQTADSNSSFAFYDAAGIASGAFRAAVNLRVPIDAAATSGALLVIRLSGACASKDEVEAEFGPLALAQVPRGDTADEETYWSRHERWGELSFGFSSQTPQCMRSTVFTMRAGR